MKRLWGIASSFDVEFAMLDFISMW